MKSRRGFLGVRFTKQMFDSYDNRLSCTYAGEPKDLKVEYTDPVTHVRKTLDI
jgi:hypothetical protein